jgi:hypothetical protein
MVMEKPPGVAAVFRGCGLYMNVYLGSVTKNINGRRIDLLRKDLQQK